MSADSRKLGRAYQAGTRTPRRRKPGESTGAETTPFGATTKPVLIQLDPDLWTTFRVTALSRGLLAKDAADQAFRDWIDTHPIASPRQATADTTTGSHDKADRPAT
jgi:hypothetical protein